jgi:hypothetical protein
LEAPRRREEPQNAGFHRKTAVDVRQYNRKALSHNKMWSRQTRFFRNFIATATRWFAAMIVNRRLQNGFSRVELLGAR